MKDLHVAVTGGSRGIGRALALEFLSSGCRVTINGRSQGTLAETLEELSGRFKGKIAGFACDVGERAAVERFYDEAEAANGPIDIWINNAGTDQKRVDFWKLPESDVSRVFDTNIMGTVNGCATAAGRMLDRGSGTIYNMEGLGSDGRISERFSFYGASKRAVRYLTESFRNELSGTNVRMCSLSPGIVVTDFLMGGLPEDPEKRARTVRVYNILADKPQPVAEYLAREVLANESRRKVKDKIEWLTGAGAFFRFATAAFRLRDLFND